MKPFKRILVPIDYSPHSSEAIQVAMDLARRYEASIQLVHVYQPVDFGLPEGFMSYAPIQETELISALTKKLEDEQKTAQNIAPSILVTSKLLHGVVASQIVKLAREDRCDLIVMGTHGRTGISHVVMGSVAEKVLRTSPCPVLSVRTEQSSED